MNEKELEALKVLVNAIEVPTTESKTRQREVREGKETILKCIWEFYKLSQYQSSNLTNSFSTLVKDNAKTYVDNLKELLTALTEIEGLLSKEQNDTLKKICERKSNTRSKQRTTKRYANTA